MMTGDTLPVCHLIHRLQAGGAEDVLVELARVAPAAGLELTVVALAGGTDTPHGKALRAAGARVDSLRLVSQWDPRGFARGLTAVRRAAPAVVHTHLKHADLLGGYAASRLGLPQVSTLHVIEDAVTGLSAVKRRLAGRARGRSTARIVAVSQAQRRWYESVYPAQADLLTVLPNGVVPAGEIGPSRRTSLRRELGAGPDDVLVLNAAIMRPGKGHDTLLAAVRLLPADCPVVVALAGDGPLAGAVAREVRGDPLLSTRVRLAGFRTDVPQLLRACDLLVQPSHADALPTVLLHAQSAGAAVVASDVGGIPEIVAPGTGVLVPPGDPAALAAVLDLLARSPERRASLGAAARERFAAEFDATRWAYRLRELYESVLASTDGDGRRVPLGSRAAGDPAQ